MEVISTDGRALPFAEGILTNHNPVAKEDATRIPETTITYLFAFVTAYTLGQTWLSKVNTVRTGMTISPHRQENEAKR